MKNVVISPAVEIAMSSLDPAEVRRVQEYFDYLQRWDEDEVVRKNSVKLESVPGVYVLWTTTDLRVFFRFEGDTVKVLDVARTPTILATVGVSPGGVTVVGSPNGVTGRDIKVK